MSVASRFESLGRMNVKRIFLGALVATGAWLAFTTTASAQTAAAPTTGAADKEQHRISDQDLTLMRQDIRSKKKQLIAQNLKLTDTEATKFWPAYDRYIAETIKVKMHGSLYSKSTQKTTILRPRNKLIVSSSAG